MGVRNRMDKAKEDDEESRTMVLEEVCLPSPSSLKLYSNVGAY